MDLHPLLLLPFPGGGPSLLLPWTSHFLICILTSTFTLLQSLITAIFTFLKPRSEQIIPLLKKKLRKALVAVSNKLGKISSPGVQALHCMVSKLLPLFYSFIDPMLQWSSTCFLSMPYLSQPSCLFLLLEFLCAIHPFELATLCISLKANCICRTSSKWYYPV